MVDSEAAVVRLAEAEAQEAGRIEVRSILIKNMAATLDYISDAAAFFVLFSVPVTKKLPQLLIG